MASFDWFTLVGSGGSDQAKRTLRKWCGDLNQGTGGEGYNRRYFSEDKAVFFDENVQNSECWKVSLPGLVCAKLDEAIKGPILEYLEQGARISRVDCAVDLYGFDLVPHVKETIDHLNRNGWLKKRGNSIRGRGEDPGWTEYVGSIHSERFTRIYDKGAKESNQPDYWLRFETVLKRRWAYKVGPMLQAEQDWPKLAQGLAATSADEIRSLAPEIYEKVYQGSLVPLSVDIKRKNLDGFLLNAEKQVFKTLALMAQTEGMDIHELIRVLGLDQVKPSERQSRHSPLLADLSSLLDESGTRLE